MADNTRERRFKIIMEIPEVWAEETVDGIEAVINSEVAIAQEQLLDELEKKAVEVTTVQYQYDKGATIIGGWTNNAVPLPAIEAKRKELKEK